MLARTAVLIAMLCCSAHAAAAVRCESADRKTLYIDDGLRCPSGYRNAADGDNVGGSLSVVGKSAATQRQEENFLRQRAAEERQTQANYARDQRNAVIAENNRRANCAMLRNQLRQSDYWMRQGNAWDNMRQLRSDRQSILNEQAALGC